jgi:hypothetical protein
MDLLAKKFSRISPQSSKKSSKKSKRKRKPEPEPEPDNFDSFSLDSNLSTVSEKPKQKPKQEWTGGRRTKKRSKTSYTSGHMVA